MKRLEHLSQRTLIIGNSGSGKSALSDRLNTLTLVPVVDLDLLHWEGDVYGRKRDEEVARHMVREIASRELWIMEGVYGWLAEVAVPRATSLIWLDFPWTLCHAGLLARGSRRGATEQDVTVLLKWAEHYWERQTSSSFAGHARIFEKFSGIKFRLRNREEIERLLDSLRGNLEN